MSTYIIDQFRFGVYCLFFGTFITLLYDFLLILREVIRHSSFWVSVEDFFFWIGSAFGIFFLLHQMNYGKLRWAAVLLIFLGMLIYKKIFGNLFVIFMSTICKRILHLVVRVVGVPLKLVKSWFLKAFSALRKCGNRVKNRLTGDIKGVKINLCKHFDAAHKAGKKRMKDESKKIP